MRKNTFFSAFKEIDPRGGSYIFFILSIILSGFISYYISNEENTIKYIEKTTDILLTVEIDIFAAFFTVYSLVITFLQKKFIKHLLKINEDYDYDYLKYTLCYMENIAYLYCVSILLTMTLKIIASMLPDDYAFFSCNFYNIMLSCLFLFVFYFIVIRVIFELKSMIFNAMVLLKGSIKLKIIEIEQGDLDD